MFVVIQFYCPVALTAPSNANAPVTRPRIVDTVLTYICNLGYSGAPSVTCSPLTQFIGNWTAFNDSCQCVLLIHTVLFIPYGKFVPYGKYSVGVNLKTSKDKDMRLIFSNMQEMKN